MPLREPHLTGNARRAAICAGVLGLALASAGCTGQTDGVRAAAAAAGPTTSVIVPGGPGGTNTTLPGTEVRPPEPAPSFNHADVHYLQMMIPHHRQAMVMGDLASDRAEDAGVRGLADRINDSQRPEIDMMAGWLINHGETVPSDDGTGGHPHMPGMATPEELAALGEASGRAFDRMYLTLMRDHHRGAVTMAEDLLSAGIDQRVSEMATGLIATQTAEIDRMNEMLRRLGG